MVQKSENTQTNKTATERPPIVVVMGHVDHGKSTLLDYIRKSNVVAGEAGGITQHTSAYEVTHINSDKKKKKITFLDTPGHEAFSLMRSLGTNVADIALLVVAADDGVKAQTTEALNLIQKTKTPYIVVLNKIDLPKANVEKVKQDLAEHNVYLEGYGGDVPFVAVSSKTGEGVCDLLDLILLVAELEELTGTQDACAEGVVVESHHNPKKGNTAVLIIKNGTLAQGSFIVAENSYSPVRRLEDFNGIQIKEAIFSSPVQVIGFNTLPDAGALFTSCQNKKEADALAQTFKKKVEVQTETHTEDNLDYSEEDEVTLVPIVLKADTAGTLKAIEQEIKKGVHEGVQPNIVFSGVGAISESDIQRVSGIGKEAFVVGFNIKIEKEAQRLADQFDVPIHTFDIIYKLTEWMFDELEKRKPKIMVEEMVGKAKIIRVFSIKKNKQIIGGKVLSGKFASGEQIKIVRREHEIGRGSTLELQHNKEKTKEVEKGLEFGAHIEAKQELAPNDVLEIFKIVEK